MRTRPRANFYSIKRGYYQMSNNNGFGEESNSSGNFVDKTLVCKDCGNEFVFTAGEQEFYAEKGFQNEPQRCKACRDARKRNDRGSRELYETTCAQCGKVARVPFQPSNDRPVYCSECFEARRNEN